MKEVFLDKAIPLSHFLHASDLNYPLVPPLVVHNFFPGFTTIH